MEHQNEEIQLNHKGYNMDHQFGDNPSISIQQHINQATMIDAFRKRFITVLVLTIPIILLSTMIQHFIGVNWQFFGSSYILLALSSVVYFYGGWPFLKGLMDEVKAKNPGMMLLIGFAITIAYSYSVAIIFGLKGMDFFWELATLILIMLLGHWIEMKSVAEASKELELLVQLMPSYARIVMVDMVQDIKTDTLKENDSILVKPGEKVAADGIISKGTSYLNESLLTGKSKPVLKIIGDAVMAGSINGNDSIEVTVSHAVKDSYLFKLIQLINDIQASKSKNQLLADRAAKWLTLIAIVAGVATFLFWYLTGQSLAFAMERMVTVIVICCPHALGLAVPLVVAKSTALSAKNGLLIKNRTAFENAGEITTIIFDKTGTLTVGEFEVSKICSLKKGLSEDEIVRLASGRGENSEYLVAAGILQKVKNLSIPVQATEIFDHVTGKSLNVPMESQKVLVVNQSYLKENKIAEPEGYSVNDTEIVVFVIFNNEMVGYIVLADKLKSESIEAIKILKNNNIKVLMVTGDDDKVAKVVSDQLELDGYFAEVLPDQKMQIVKGLKNKGEFVAMIGDGVNDAPALAQSDVGIVVGSGTDVAAEPAGIILVNNNLKDINNLILFGKATYHKMIENLVWATRYNLFAIPLAAGVLYKYGFILSPAIGAIIMSLSTIIVAINAQLLKKISNK